MWTGLPFLIWEQFFNFIPNFFCCVRAKAWMVTPMLSIDVSVLFKLRDNISVFKTFLNEKGRRGTEICRQFRNIRSSYHVDLIWYVLKQREPTKTHIYECERWYIERLSSVMCRTIVSWCTVENLKIRCVHVTHSSFRLRLGYRKRW